MHAKKFYERFDRSSVKSVCFIKVFNKTRMQCNIASNYCISIEDNLYVLFVTDECTNLSAPWTLFLSTNKNNSS